MKHVVIGCGALLIIAGIGVAMIAHEMGQYPSFVDVVSGGSHE